jgi:hypothetical protein
LGGLIPLVDLPGAAEAGQVQHGGRRSDRGALRQCERGDFHCGDQFPQEHQSSPIETYASAFLAVMESPAIIVGVMLGKGALGGGKFSLSDQGVRHALRDAVLGKGVLLLHWRDDDWRAVRQSAAWRRSKAFL